MKKILDYLPTHFALCLMLGIVLQYKFQIWDEDPLALEGCLLFLLGVLFWCHLYNKRQLFTVIMWLLFVFVGIASIFLQEPTTDTRHYSHFNTTNTTSIFAIQKVLKKNTYNYRYEAAVVQIASKKTTGKVLLQVSIDSLTSLLEVGDKIVSQPVFSVISPPLNPHQFHYKNYLKTRGIYQQVFLKQQAYQKRGVVRYSVRRHAAKTRKKLQELLQEAGFSNEAYGLINAMLLGERSAVSKELLNSYARAGILHILAVSGLHVGVLLLLLNRLFQPLKRGKYGSLLVAICIVLLLWSFAFIAGLSASVVRAVTMFTFIAVGQAFHKKHVVLYAVIASLFFLLLVHPFFLFDVGFQLSYSAVFSIVLVQPKLDALWRPKKPFFRKFWQLTTVSLAAQLGVLPISLYYFHQFPSLFLLSNWVVVPFLSLVLLLGICTFVLLLFGCRPHFFMQGYDLILRMLNTFVQWIGAQEQFLITNISFSGLNMLLLYLIFILGFRFFVQQTPRKLLFFIGSVLLFQGVLLQEKQQRMRSEAWIVFHKTKQTILGHRVGETLAVYCDNDTLSIAKLYFLKSYAVAENCTVVQKGNIPDISNFFESNVLFVDSLGVYAVEGLKGPIVVLRNSPRINLERLIQTVRPIQIIADGSNYTSYTKHWKQVCEKQKTPFFATRKNGAYVLKK